MFVSEWREFPSAPCFVWGGKKKTWWQLASRCCWNRVRPWHASELVYFLVGLRTYQHQSTALRTSGYSFCQELLKKNTKIITRNHGQHFLSVYPSIYMPVWKTRHNHHKPILHQFILFSVRDNVTPTSHWCVLGPWDQTQFQTLGKFWCFVDRALQYIYLSN